MSLSYKKFVLCAISLPCFFMLSLCALLYLYDPLQIFHTPYFRNVTFLSDARVQNLGIIKHYNFNSIILGSSMLENTQPKDANKILQNLDSINNGGGGI